MARLGTILRWSAQVLLFGLCLEVAARADDWITYRAPIWASRYDAELLREADPDGIRRNRPGARFEKWRINSLGFRGEELPPVGPGRRRLVCLGQSETFGLYEEEGAEWPARLARLLGSRHPEIDVINASVVGLRQEMRRAYLERYVLPLHPQIVVLYLDVLSDAGVARSGPPATQAAPPGVGPPADILFPRSRVLPKLRQRLKAIIPENAAAAVRIWLLDRTLRRLEESVLGGTPPLDALPIASVLRFEAHVREIVQLLRERHVVPILATYPTLGSEQNRQQIHFQIASERVWMIEFSEMGLIDAARQLNAAVRRVAHEMEVPLVDADAAVPKETEYFADYVHYTGPGADLVAERVLEVLEGSGDLGTVAPAR